MWQFHLSRYFRLNITFECISLKFGQLYHCYLGNVSVISFSNTLSQSFQYCGIHSHMINYPQYQNIDLTVSLRPYVFYNIKLSYSVIDPDNVISFPTTVPVEWVLYFPKRSKFLQKMYILVDTLCFIKIVVTSLFNNSLKIYDGPDFLSKSLQFSRRSIYVTSTFQCMIYMLSNIPIVNSSYDILQYMPEENYITKGFIIDSHKYSLINYPFTKSTPLAIINLTKTTESNSLLNIAIKNFTNNYDDNSLCRYGGIIFYDMIRGRNIKAQSVCENYKEFYKHRNIYSHDSEMLLSMYSYDDYGELHAVLNISITDCRLTYKNRYIFTYNFYCTPKHFHFRRKRQFCNYLLIKTDSQ